MQFFTNKELSAGVHYLETAHLQFFVVRSMTMLLYMNKLTFD